MGAINYIEFQLPRDLRLYYDNVGIQPSRSIPLSSVSQKDSTINQQVKYKCYECSVALTDKFCIDCKQYYCHLCFSQIHSVGKSFRQHQLRTVNTKTNSKTISEIDEIRVCDQHKEYALNYYCIDCKKVICEQCKLNHQDHDQSSLLLEVSFFSFIFI